MNSMFDTRNQDQDKQKKALAQSMEQNKKKYDRMLFSDWIIKVYDKCSQDCIKPPKSTDENPGAMTDFEKSCATNCIRKYEKSYKLYGSIEKHIFNAYMETTDIDPEQFYAQINKMSKE